jgi:hypothetical protein
VQCQCLPPIQAPHTQTHKGRSLAYQLAKNCSAISQQHFKIALIANETYTVSLGRCYFTILDSNDTVDNNVRIEKVTGGKLEDQRDDIKMNLGEKSNEYLWIQLAQNRVRRRALIAVLSIFFLRK